MENLPSEFIERFGRILPREDAAGAERFFDLPRPVSARINTLKVTIEDAQKELAQKGWSFRRVSWLPEAIVFDQVNRKDLVDSSIVSQGRIYLQGLSSMLPAKVLAPVPGELVLDMCAAPGSKTTQLAAIMQNEGRITAVDSVRPRFYRLKSVVTLMGAANVQCKLADARRFRTEERFDKILVDAPCSSEGRFQRKEPESFAYWSLRKIKEMRQKQRGIILAAARLLKSEGTMIYSTCTFAPEENEEVVDWFLRKTSGEFTVLPIDSGPIERYRSLLTWNDKHFDPQVENCLRITPTADMEGFFLAKIIRN